MIEAMRREDRRSADLLAEGHRLLNKIDKDIARLGMASN